MVNTEDSSVSSQQDVIQRALADPVVTEAAQANPSPKLVSSESAEESLSGRALQDAMDRGMDRTERQELILQRKWFAIGLFIVLGAQLLFMNVVFILIGVHVISRIDSTTLRFYVTGSLGEIFGLVTVATRFVFSDKKPLGNHGS